MRSLSDSSLLTLTFRTETQWKCGACCRAGPGPARVDMSTPTAGRSCGVHVTALATSAPTVTQLPHVVCAPGVGELLGRSGKWGLEASVHMQSTPKPGGSLLMVTERPHCPGPSRRQGPAGHWAACTVCAQDGQDHTLAPRAWGEPRRPLGGDSGGDAAISLGICTRCRRCPCNGFRHSPTAQGRVRVPGQRPPQGPKEHGAPTRAPWARTLRYRGRSSGKDWPRPRWQ